MALRTALRLAALSLALVAPAAIAQSGPGTGPTPGAGIVQQCAEAMQQAAMTARQQMMQAAHATVQEIQALAAANATAPEIIAAARAGAHAVGMRARAGAMRINELGHACAQELQAMNAPPQAFHALSHARGNALRAVAEGQRAAHMAIHHALRNAIGPVPPTILSPSTGPASGIGSER